MFFTLYVEHKKFGMVKFSSSGMQGEKTALGAVDVFVSAVICSANVDCFASSAYELCGPSTPHPHGLFTLLCRAAFIWPLCIPWVW